jgi:cell division protease FtsH
MSLAPREPVDGLRPPDQGPPEVDRTTRPRLKLGGRISFLLVFAATWFLLVWSAVASDPILPWSDAFRIELTDAAWVLVLFGLELLRQIHFLISERSSAYHGFWMNKVFGASQRFGERRFNDWTRYRMARVVKWLVFIALAMIVLGKFLHTSPVLAAFTLPARIWQVLPFILQIVLVVSLGILQFVAIFWFMSRGGVEVYYPDDIKTRFTDVWGQDSVLDRVKESIVFLERPREIEDKGGYVPGGILLWGPPGTGKTLMAEAVAGETGKPYVFVDPGAFINMFFGVGILKVKSLFRKLRKLSLRYGGVIVFFDEADSLGSRGALASGGNFPRGMAEHRDGCRGMSYLSAEAQWHITRTRLAPTAARAVMPAGAGGGMMGGGMGTLQALLTELSGLKKPRGLVNRYVRRALGMRPKPPPKYRILVMMATNLPEALDEALLRPGRIDRIYKVGYPSKVGRMRTYEGYFNKVRHALTPEEIENLATMTPYATGATIKDLVNESLVQAIRNDREVITFADVLKAKQLKELGPPEDVEYIPRDRHAVAIHEACHAVIAYRNRSHFNIDIATIEKGGDTLGMVKAIRVEDQFVRWRSEYTADIHVTLASLAGERMFFEDDNSSGVSGDLENATLVATQMEGYWGMGSTVSSAAASGQLDTGTPGRRAAGARWWSTRRPGAAGRPDRGQPGPAARGDPAAAGPAPARRPRPRPRAGDLQDPLRRRRGGGARRRHRPTRRRPAVPRRRPVPGHRGLPPGRGGGPPQPHADLGTDAGAARTRQHAGLGLGRPARSAQRFRAYPRPHSSRRCPLRLTPPQAGRLVPNQPFCPAVAVDLGIPWRPGPHWRAKILDGWFGGNTWHRWGVRSVVANRLVACRDPMDVRPISFVRFRSAGAGPATRRVRCWWSSAAPGCCAPRV